MISTPQAAYWCAVHLPLFLSRLFLLTHFCVQLAFFCVSALAHGTAFARWRLRSKGDQPHSWALYGWFTGLSFCGSTAGALAYGIRLRVLELFYVYSNFHSIVKPTLDEQLQMQILIVQNLSSCRCRF